MVKDIDFHNKLYMIQKIGHFSGFLVLTLIFTDLGRQKKGILGAIGFAVLTEILQLYFNRDGRIFDMFIDSLGILSAYVLCYSSQKNEKPF
jgi:VanZ family protein